MSLLKMPKIKVSPLVPVGPLLAIHQQECIAVKVKIYALQECAIAVRLLQHLILKSAKSSPTDANVPNASLVITRPIVYNVSG